MSDVTRKEEKSDDRQMRRNKNHRDFSILFQIFTYALKKKKKKGYLERENENNFCPENQDERYRSQKIEKQKILEHTLQIIACLKSAV